MEGILYPLSLSPVHLSSTTCILHASAATFGKVFLMISLIRRKGRKKEDERNRVRNKNTIRKAVSSLFSLSLALSSL